VRWKTKQSFDGKLCQKYSYQNYQNLIIGFQVTVKNVGDVFLKHSVKVNLISWDKKYKFHLFGAHAPHTLSINARYTMHRKIFDCIDLSNKVKEL